MKNKFDVLAGLEGWVLGSLRNERGVNEEAILQLQAAGVDECTTSIRTCWESENDESSVYILGINGI